MSDRPARAQIGTWRAADWIGVAVTIALGMAVTWDACHDIVRNALDDERQGHILLVPLLVAWLVWIRRGRLRRCPRDGRLVGVAFIAAGYGLYRVGGSADVMSFWHMGPVVIAMGCFLCFAGRRYLARLGPAFFATLFLVPVPGVIRDQVAFPLQTVTADATHRALQLFGVEGARNGNTLNVNGMEILVLKGPRMVFVLLMVSYAFAYTMPIRNSVRVFIVLVSPITAILCNVIHLVPTVSVYAFVSPVAGAWVHAVGSWLIMPFAFLLLLGIFRALRWASIPVYRYTLAYGK